MTDEDPPGLLSLIAGAAMVNAVILVAVSVALFLLKSAILNSEWTSLGYSAGLFVYLSCLFGVVAWLNSR